MGLIVNCPKLSIVLRDETSYLMQLKLQQKCPQPFQNGEVMFRIYLPGILAMSIIVVSSNILVQFLYGNWLTYGAFTYPLAFLVTDIMNRVYGLSGSKTNCFCWIFNWRGLFNDWHTGMIELDKDFYAPAVTFRIALHLVQVFF